MAARRWSVITSYSVIIMFVSVSSQFSVFGPLYPAVRAGRGLVLSSGAVGFKGAGRYRAAAVFMEVCISQGAGAVSGFVPGWVWVSPSGLAGLPASARVGGHPVVCGYGAARGICWSCGALAGACSAQ